MKLKVCGLKEEANILQVVAQQPDFLGFIFYEKSPRFINELSADFLKTISIPKVGVFVNATPDEIKESVEKYELNAVQLHGDEGADFVNELVGQKITVIKVFRVSDKLPDNLDEYKMADYFLFDTKTDQYGGSGQKFDWSILEGVDHPFLLSGGIGPVDLNEIKELKLSNLIGIDVNSKVEIKPGLKDIEKIKELKALL